MKDCYYNIELDGHVILSNLPKELMAKVFSLPFGHEVYYTPDKKTKYDGRKKR